MGTIRKFWELDRDLKEGRRGGDTVLRQRGQLGQKHRGEGVPLIRSTLGRVSQEAGKGPGARPRQPLRSREEGSQRLQGGNGQDAVAPGSARGRDPLPPVRKGGLSARAKRGRRGGRGRSKKPF